MFISLTVDEYNEDNIFTTDSIRNTVIDNSSFIRIIYSTRDIALNGIIITIPFQNFTINKYFNKWRCNFSCVDNADLVKDICRIEREILQRVDVDHKIPCYKICDQLENNFVKVFLEDYVHEPISSDVDILLKISGIWVSEEEYGITYKFLLSR